VIELYEPEVVRAMDEATIASGISSLTLMERAGSSLAREVLRVAGRSYGLRVAVLCGKGNNGGDGLVAARALAQAGAAPLVYLAADEAALSDDAAWQLARWRASGGRVVSELPAADILVDCLLGTGAQGAPRGDIAAIIDQVARLDAPVVACDLPSGVNALTGEVPGTAVRATSTVVIGAEKIGLRLWPAREHCGELVLADIGLVRSGAHPSAVALQDRDVARLLPPPQPQAEKRSRGVVLIVAGSVGMTGAATLAASSALAAGAGLISVATPQAARSDVAQKVIEAVTVGLPQEPDAAADLVEAHAQRVDAVVAGPGIGVTPWSATVVRRLLATCRVPLVLDADALNVFRDDPQALATHRGPHLVLTPHRRELARLVADAGAEAETYEWSRRSQWVGEVAGKWNATVVVKGPGTMVVDPDGRTWVNATGGPALATGGTGDVLAGLLGALLALSGADSATVAAGVHVHGLAGDLAAAARTARSTRARDVLQAIPEAWRQIEDAA